MKPSKLGRKHKLKIFKDMNATIIGLLNREVKFSNDDFTSEMVSFMAKYAYEKGVDGANELIAILQTIDTEITKQDSKSEFDIAYSFGLSVSKEQIFLGVRPITVSGITPRGHRKNCVIIGEYFFTDFTNFASEFSEWLGDRVADHFLEEEEDGEPTDFYK